MGLEENEWEKSKKKERVVPGSEMSCVGCLHVYLSSSAGSFQDFASCIFSPGVKGVHTLDTKHSIAHCFVRSMPLSFSFVSKNHTEGAKVLHDFFQHFHLILAMNKERKEGSGDG